MVPVPTQVSRWAGICLCLGFLASQPSNARAMLDLNKLDDSLDLCTTTPLEIINSSLSDPSINCSLYAAEMSQGFMLFVPKDDSPVEYDECMGDYIFPFLLNEFMWPGHLRAVIYLLFLGWCFLGVAIISDHFMAAIEVITSKEKVIVVQNEDGEPEEHRVLVWNETVANLTLMALGSSAPEILLSIVETVGTLNQPPEDGLGPGTIVGSAAFNLLVITSVCVVALPEGEKRVIENYGVFIITSFFSVFAYVWMLIVLGEDGVVDVHEAIITFLLFPILVGLSYLESKGLFAKLFGKSATAKVRPDGGHVIGLDTANHTALRDRRKFSIDSSNPEAQQDAAKAAAEFATGEAHAGKRVITMEDKEKGRIAELLQSLPRGLSDDDMAKAVASDLLKDRTSANRYRIDARRKLAGGRSVISKRLDFLKRHTTKRFAQNTPSELDRLGLGSLGAVKAPNTSPVILEDAPLDEENTVANISATLPRVSFTAYAFCVNENAGFIELPVMRTGTDEELQLISMVYFETRSGTARGGEDFEHTDGKLIFLPGEKEKTITVNIIDDNVYEPDETFQVVLSVKGADHNVDLEHSAFSTAEVTIIDDDLPGTFTFEDSAMVVRESEGVAHIKVLRKNGIAGRIKVQFKTKDASAKSGSDYLEASGTLIFEHGVREAIIEVAIMDNKTYERDSTFAVEFEIVNFPECGAIYGEHRVNSITITSDENYKATVDRVASLMRLHLEAVDVGSGSWKEQLINVLTVQGEDGAEASNLDCALHIMSFGWKVLFALVPPTSYYNGKLSFFVSLLFILIITIVVGDVAKIFGCLIGLDNSVTAITFVALGTSLPDTFASKMAAENDDNADNSIGNVTGSNSVNVFLGLGLPWVIGAVYKAAHGEQFIVKPGNLSFSVLIFCIIAVIYFALMYARRRMGFGELGGPRRAKIVSCVILIFLWIAYVLLSALQTKGIISNPLETSS